MLGSGPSPVSSLHPKRQRKRSQSVDSGKKKGHPKYPHDCKDHCAACGENIIGESTEPGAKRAHFPITGCLTEEIAPMLIKARETLESPGVIKASFFKFLKHNPSAEEYGVVCLCKRSNCAWKVVMNVASKARRKPSQQKHWCAGYCHCHAYVYLCHMYMDMCV